MLIKKNVFILLILSLIIVLCFGSVSFARIVEDETYFNATKEYEKYRWEIESGIMEFSLRCDDYDVFETLIPNSSGSTSPLVGLFKYNELEAFYGGLYTKYGETYFKYFHIGDFIYASCFYDVINSGVGMHWTYDYAIENSYKYKQFLEEGRDITEFFNLFEFYDPSLTTYSYYEYIFKGDKLFLLDTDNKKLIEITTDEDSMETSMYEDIMIEKERILNNYDKQKEQ